MNWDNPFATPLSLLISFFVLLIAIATLLMPLYVISMHTQMKKMGKTMEKLLWHVQKHHEREERKGREG